MDFLLDLINKEKTQFTKLLNVARMVNMKKKNAISISWKGENILYKLNITMLMVKVMMLL